MSGVLMAPPPPVPGARRGPSPGGTSVASMLRKLWRLLTRRQRRSAIVLVGLMLVGVVLETLGVGLVIPTLALMTQHDLAARYPAIAPLLHRLGDPSYGQLVVGAMLVLVGVFVIKGLYLGFLSWRQMRFAYRFKADLSLRLYAGYLRQPYPFFLDRNSAQLMNNVVYQVTEFTNAIQQGLLLATELLNLLAISALLLVVEPVGTLLVLGILGVAGWGFNRLTQDRILRWGEARLRHEGLRLQRLQEGLGGIKEMKLLGREHEFLAQYAPHNAGAARVNEYQQTLQQWPRLWLEMLAIVGLAALVMVMIGQGRALDALLPTLGLFVAAAFRLMPSANRVVGAVQTVRYCVPVIDTLYDELALLESTPTPAPSVSLPLTKTLRLERVTFRYASAETDTLRDVRLTIPVGGSIGFIGDSGAGKSTLVDVILGLLTPTGGTVSVDSIDIQGRLRGWQDQIGYVPQTIFLTDDTLRRNVAFGLPDERIDEAAVWDAIRAAQLEGFVRDLPKGLDTLVGERGVRISGGQRQRLGIARALYRDPAVLVLDEATSSLDTATESGVMDAVRALKGEKTILIIAHRFSTLEQCDRIYRVERGQVVETRQVAGALR